MNKGKDLDIGQQVLSKLITIADRECKDCKTKEEYIEVVKKDIERFKRDKWCGETNLDFAKQELQAVESGEIKIRSKA